MTTSVRKITVGTQRRGAARRQPTALPYGLVLPIIAYEALFIFFPILKGIGSSFTKGDVGGPSTWVGLANYQRMLTDATFWEMLRSTFIYVVAVVGIAVGAGLGSALVLHRRFHGRTFVRGLMMLPWAFPDVPTVLVFVWMLNPTFGVVNVFARLLPWVHGNQQWLLQPQLAMISVVLITAWKAYPFYSLVILAALQGVSTDLYDAARVDGATPRQSFVHVTLPGISPTLLLLVVLASIFSLRQFTIIFLLTGGGPGTATETLVLRIYNTAFRFYDFTYSGALGVAGLVIALTITLFFLALQRRRDMEV